MKSFAVLSEAACEGYRMSKRVDRKVQNKVKSLESEPVVHFLPDIGKFGKGVTPNNDDT
jgi:hypothetical protein